MAETQVLGWGTQSAPASRETTGSHAMELLAIDATFDGTGAAGSFIPTAKIVSDAGEEVGAFPLGSSLAAGDSATVTFAPFLRPATAAASTAAAPFEAFFEVITVASASDSHFQFFGNIDFGADLFDLGGGAFLPRARTAGLYAWTVFCFSQSNIANKVGRVILSIDLAGGSTPSTYQMDIGQDFPLDGIGAGKPTGAVAATRYLLAGQNFDVAIENGAAGPVDYVTTVVVQAVT